MTASKSDTPRTSAEMIGATDLAKVDAHEITAEEYEEIPELTDEMIARADLYENGELIRRGRGRPKVDSPKQQVTMRLDADLIATMRASGPGWQVRANEALRERFKA
jgi:uncharacterized protein (DUF4415 family)